MAYAFLLYQRDKLLKEVAEKRLSAIREFTDLGSGIKIAMRDLEIRGAGNLLGEAQSGHMEAVGYDLYCKMLNEAVRQLKGGPEAETFTTLIDLNVDAYLPEYYIKNEYQKLIYINGSRRLVGRVRRYDGRTDRPLWRYSEKSAAASCDSILKSLAHSVYVTAIEQKVKKFDLQCMKKQRSIHPVFLNFLDSYKNDLIFRQKNRRIFCIAEKAETKKQYRKCTGYSETDFEDLKKLT